MGAKRVPASIHRLMGTYREDRHGGGVEARPLASVPPPPRRLVEEYEAGAAEWERLAPELHRLGVLSAVDLTIFEVYCTVFDRWVRAERDLLELGYMMETPNGYQQQNPAMQVVNKCIMQMRDLSAEFGLTPATRARLRIIDQKTDDDDLLNILDQASKKKAVG